MPLRVTRILLLLFLAVWPVSSFSFSETEGNLLAREGVRLLLAREYDQLEDFLDSLEKREADSLLLFLGRMAYSQVRNFACGGNRKIERRP